MRKRRGKTYHHGDLRAVVLELALKAIEQRPPEQLSLRDLARHAGVTSMAIYRHFADRAALMSALADHGFAELGARMREVETTANAKAALVAIGAVYVSFAVEHRGLFQLMYGGTPPDTPIRAGQPPHEAYAVLAERIAAVASPAKRDIAFLASWSLVHGLAMLLVTQRLRVPIADPAAIAEQVGRFFVRAFD